MNKTTDLTSLSDLPSGLAASIVASSGELAGLEGALAERFGYGFTMIALEPGAAIDHRALGQSTILVVEIDPEVPASLERVQTARALAPHLSLIAAVRDVDLPTTRALLRRGFSDVIALPFDAEELIGAVVDLGSTHIAVPAALAPMRAVVHSTGGIGASTVVTNLAGALAAADPDCKICVVDLDFQFGEIASLFGVDPASSVMDCLSAGDRLDFDIVSNACLTARDNIAVLAAPPEIVPPEGIDTDQLLRLLTMLRQHYDHVLLDLPADWSGLSLSAACACDELLVVVDQTVRTLGRARRTTDLLDSVDFPAEKVRLIVNRAEKRLFQAIGTDEVASAMKREVAVALPLVKSSLDTMQDEGQLLVEADHRAAFSKAIHELAEHIRYVSAGEAV